MIVAQFTDTHVVARGSRYFLIDTARHLRQSIAFVEALQPRPDAVIISGDLTNLGREREYAHLRELLAALTIPWYVVPGNHDSRRRFRSAFADRREVQGEGRVRFAVDGYPVRLFGLDSVMPRNLGGIGGGLDEASLAWLERELAREPGRPALVFLHHPPFETGMRYIDLAPFVEQERLWSILAAHGASVRVVAGHVHSVHACEREGIVGLTSRSTSPQVVPEVLERRPLWLRRERPGFALHQWSEREGFRTIDYAGDGKGWFAPSAVIGEPSTSRERELSA